MGRAVGSYQNFTGFHLRHIACSWAALGTNVVVELLATPSCPKQSFTRAHLIIILEVGLVVAVIEDVGVEVGVVSGIILHVGG